MIFGPAAPDLLPGAHNAVNTCLSVRRGEKVALVADEASRVVAASLEQALADAGAEARCLLIESVARRPLRTAPGEILAAFEGVDAGILCVQPQEGELPVRRAIVGLIERLKQEACVGSAA